jgi:hypothetical protein
MDRRHFIRFITGTISAATIARARRVSAQSHNPKVYLFGMILIDNSGPLKARVPRLDAMYQHRAFIAASDATIKALGGTSVPLNQQSGLHHIHSDYTLARFPMARPLDPVTTISLSGGAGAAVAQQALLDRLPSLAALSARAGGPQRAVNMPTGSFDIALSGGQLRPPGKPGASPGADPAVRWQIAVNGSNVGTPMVLTDMSVFESAEPTLRITVDGNSVVLTAGDIAWIFNLPLLQDVDTTPREIEHIAEWTALLNPRMGAGTLKASTSFPLVRAAGGGGQFNHPNLSLRGAKQSALTYFQKTHQKVVAAGFPPECDLCLQCQS